MSRLFGIYEKALPASLTMTQKLSTAKKAGYDYMELCFDESKENLKRLDSPRSEIKVIKSLAQEIGMGLHSLCLSAHRKYSLGSMDDATAQSGIELSKKAFDFACETGARVILIAGYDVFYEESTEATRSRFLENTKTICEIARNQGLILALENVDASISCDVESCIKILSLVNAPNLRLYLDFGNMNAQGIDYLSQIQKAADWIEAIHIKDTLPGAYKDIEFGSGTVDFSIVSELLKQQRCDAPAVVEMWYQKESDAFTRISNALEFVKARFDL